MPRLYFAVHEQQHSIVHQQVKKTTPPTKSLVEWVFLPVQQRLFLPLNERSFMNVFIGPSMNEIVCQEPLFTRSWTAVWHCSTTCVHSPLMNTPYFAGGLSHWSAHCCRRRHVNVLFRDYRLKMKGYRAVWWPRLFLPLQWHWSHIRLSSFSKLRGLK